MENVRGSTSSVGVRCPAAPSPGRLHATQTAQIARLARLTNATCTAVAEVCVCGEVGLARTLRLQCEHPNTFGSESKRDKREIRA